MSTQRKISLRKALKKKTSTLLVLETRVGAGETLFPEKLKKANEILRNTKFNDPRIG